MGDNGLLAEPQHLVHERIVDQSESISPANDPESGLSDSLINTSGSTADPNTVDAKMAENVPTNSLASGVPAALTSPHESIQDGTSVAKLPTAIKATVLPTPLEQQTHQIHRLKTQNKVLMGSLAGTILLGGLAFWQLHTTQQSALQLRQSTPSSIVPAHQPAK